ncbi:MAG: ribonuclease HII [Deltaproteobacteria bacterium]|nr:MAG: ribonuclease HII [Deltaproteobacteria bacterium]
MTADPPLPHFRFLERGRGTADIEKSPSFFFEKAIRKAYGTRYIAGVDEAGRGPLAGPVVAAAVILPLDGNFPGIDDSKRLTAIKRERLFGEIHAHALGVGVGIVSHEEIDALNIRRATLLAMKKAVQALPVTPDFCLVDGRDEIPLAVPQSPLVKGDQKSLSVAAASIIAKVTRDRIMLAYHEQFPDYGFDRNMGYGTRQHRDALKRVGPSPIHRKSFRGVLQP